MYPSLTDAIDSALETLEMFSSDTAVGMMVAKINKAYMPILSLPEPKTGSPGLEESIRETEENGVPVVAVFALIRA